MCTKYCLTMQNTEKSTFRTEHIPFSDQNHINKPINLLNNRVSRIGSKRIRICLQKKKSSTQTIRKWMRQCNAVRICNRRTPKERERERKYRKIWNIVGEVRNVFKYVTSIAMYDLHLRIGIVGRHCSSSLQNLRNFAVYYLFFFPFIDFVLGFWSERRKR